MDPNETLKEIRECVSGVGPGLHDTEMLLQAVRLAELVEALDEWLTKGGFPPSDWEPLP